MIHNLDADCNHLPELDDWHYLGTHPTWRSAVAQARRTFDNVAGCPDCAPEPGES